MPSASKILFLSIFLCREGIIKGGDMVALNIFHGFLRSCKTSNSSESYKNKMIESHIHFIIVEEKKTLKNI
jgi:hypothetical protein